VLCRISQKRRALLKKSGRQAFSGVAKSKQFIVVLLFGDLIGSYWSTDMSLRDDMSLREMTGKDFVQTSSVQNGD
jgi:hypothetical protein